MSTAQAEVAPMNPVATIPTPIAPAFKDAGGGFAALIGRIRLIPQSSWKATLPESIASKLIRPGNE